MQWEARIIMCFLWSLTQSVLSRLKLYLDWRMRVYTGQYGTRKDIIIDCKLTL